MTQKIYRTLILAALACSLSLFFATAVQAQETVALTCTGTTVCNPAGGAFATMTTGANPPTFTVSNTDGSKCGTGDTCEAYLAVLVPNGTLPAGFTVNGNGPAGSGTFNSSSTSLFGALGEGGGQDNKFTPWQTTSAAASGISTGSFTVYDFLLGSFVGSSNNGQGQEPSFAITLSGPVAAGTGFGAFYEDTNLTGGDGQIVNNSKLSESITVTPEPGSMALFGSGLVMIGGFLRRYRRGS